MGGGGALGGGGGALVHSYKITRSSVHADYQQDNLKQNETESGRVVSTHKGVN